VTFHTLFVDTLMFSPFDAVLRIPCPTGIPTLPLQRSIADCYALLDLGRLNASTLRTLFVPPLLRSIWIREVSPLAGLDRRLPFTLFLMRGRRYLCVSFFLIFCSSFAFQDVMPSTRGSLQNFLIFFTPIDMKSVLSRMSIVNRMPILPSFCFLNDSRR